MDEQRVSNKSAVEFLNREIATLEQKFRDISSVENMTKRQAILISKDIIALNELRNIRQHFMTSGESYNKEFEQLDQEASELKEKLNSHNQRLEEISAIEKGFGKDIGDAWDKLSLPARISILSEKVGEKQNDIFYLVNKDLASKYKRIKKESRYGNTRGRIFKSKEERQAKEAEELKAMQVIYEKNLKNIEFFEKNLKNIESYLEKSPEDIKYLELKKLNLEALNQYKLEQNILNIIAKARGLDLTRTIPTQSEPQVQQNPGPVQPQQTQSEPQVQQNQGPVQPQQTQPVTTEQQKNESELNTQTSQPESPIQQPVEESNENKQSLNPEDEKKKRINTVSNEIKNVYREIENNKENPQNYQNLKNKIDELLALVTDESNLTQGQTSTENKDEEQVVEPILAEKQSIKKTKDELIQEYVEMAQKGEIKIQSTNVPIQLSNGQNAGNFFKRNKEEIKNYLDQPDNKNNDQLREVRETVDKKIQESERRSALYKKRKEETQIITQRLGQKEGTIVSANKTNTIVQAQVSIQVAQQMGR